MDPTTTLYEMRDLAREVMADDKSTLSAYKLADCFDHLDSWLRKGGFLPVQWSNEGAGRK